MLIYHLKLFVATVANYNINEDEFKCIVKMLKILLDIPVQICKLCSLQSILCVALCVKVSMELKPHIGTEKPAKLALACSPFMLTLLYLWNILKMNLVF